MNGMNNQGDPETDEEYERAKTVYLGQIADELDALRALVLPFRQRFEAEGFANVEIDCQLNGWELRASRGANQNCQTPEQMKQLVQRIVRELHREVDRGLIVALVVGDQFSAAFRLQRLS